MTPCFPQEREAKERPLAFLRKAHTILFPPYGTSNATDSCVLCVYICRFMYACEQVHMCAYAYRGQRSPLGAVLQDGTHLVFWYMVSHRARSRLPGSPYLHFASTEITSISNHTWPFNLMWFWGVIQVLMLAWQALYDWAVFPGSSIDCFWGFPDLEPDTGTIWFNKTWGSEENAFQDDRVICDRPCLRTFKFKYAFCICRILSWLQAGCPSVALI